MKKDWIRLALIAIVLLAVISLLATPIALAKGGARAGGSMKAGGGMMSGGSGIRNAGSVGNVGSQISAGTGINNRLPGTGISNIGTGDRLPGNFNKPGVVDPGFSVGRPGFDRPGVIDPGFGVRHPVHDHGVDINVIGGGWGGYYPWYNQGYGYPYSLYAPANYGNDPNACYQACVLSGQYTPDQCAQMCYQPYSAGY